MEDALDRQAQVLVCFEDGSSQEMQWPHSRCYKQVTTGRNNPAGNLRVALREIRSDGTFVYDEVPGTFVLIPVTRDPQAPLDTDYVEKALPDFEQIIKKLPAGRAQIRLLTQHLWFQQALEELREARKVVTAARRVWKRDRSWAGVNALCDAVAEYDLAMREVEGAGAEP